FISPCQFNDQKISTIGGSADIYSAIWNKQNGCKQKVALKKLHERNNDILKKLFEFYSEIQLTNMVNEHRNIVTFYGFCMDKNEMCLVFEWADKGDLRNFLANKVLDWPQRYKIASEIAFGLNFGKRESPVEGTPSDYEYLYQQAWHENDSIRPSIDEILETLQISLNNQL
ncbi:27297_t:CDS:2, partial [Gigaspora margarita]